MITPRIYPFDLIRSQGFDLDHLPIIPIKAKGKRKLTYIRACCGFDIEPGVWHGMVVLEDDTVVFEVKQGPYAPIAKENIAPWTPAVEDSVAVEQFIKELEQSFETDK